jgi:hypothetical protein
MALHQFDVVAHGIPIVVDWSQLLVNAVTGEVGVLGRDFSGNPTTQASGMRGLDSPQCVF